MEKIQGKQVDASSCTVFFVEDARTSWIKSFGHTKLDGASAAAASRIDLSN
jgi:hypothetical protein